MKPLWPYYSTKKKAFYRDGDRRVILHRKNKKVFVVTGDVIPGKTLIWTTGNINLSEVKLVNRLRREPVQKKSLLFQNITLV